jgi:hypothetical protein
MNCFGCEKLITSNGGLQYYHGECRKKARERYGSMSHYIRVYKAQWRPTGKVNARRNRITLSATKWQKFLMWIKQYVRF